MIVLDASAAVSWLLDEPSPAPGLDKLVVTQRILVPAHWPVEVGHAILKALRRRRIADERVLSVSQSLRDLDLIVAPPLEISGVLPLLQFARQYGLTMYDAGYVELAMKRQAALATLDDAMRKVAEKLGVELAL